MYIGLIVNNSSVQAYIGDPGSKHTREFKRLNFKWFSSAQNSGKIFRPIGRQVYQKF